MKQLSITLLFFTTICTSCTKEDLADCDTGQVKIYYEYVLNKSHTDLFKSSVKQMAIYIFDQNKLFRDSIIIDNTQRLGENQLLQLNLSPGEYTLVSCGGQLETYSIGKLTKGEVSLDEFSLQARLSENTTRSLAAVSTLNDLYWGATTLTVPDTKKSVEQKVSLTKMTNTIKVNITLAETRGDTSNALISLPDTEIYCIGYSGQYIWDGNQYKNAHQLKYMPAGINKVSDTRVEADMKILRLIKDYDVNKPTMLTIKNKQTGITIYEINIVDELLALKDGNGNSLFRTQEDLDREDTYTFDIQISDDGNRKLTISVQVNGWQTVIVPPAEWN